MGNKIIEHENDEERKTETVEEHIKNHLEPQSYSYSGKLEYLEAHVDRISSAFATLINILVQDGSLYTNDINDLTQPLFGDKVRLVDEDKYNE